MLENVKKIVIILLGVEAKGVFWVCKGVDLFLKFFIQTYHKIIKKISSLEKYQARKKILQ